MDTGEVGTGSRLVGDGDEKREDLGLEESSRYGEIGMNGGDDHQIDGEIGGSPREREFCSDENGWSSRVAQVNGEDGKEKISASVVFGSPVSGVGSEDTVTSPPSKGKGLKKWRRVRRSMSNDGGLEMDSGRTLKRGHGVQELVNTRDENKLKNDDGEGESSVASADIGNFGSGSNDIGNFGSGSNDIGNFGSESNCIENIGSSSHLGGDVRTVDLELAELLVSGIEFAVGAADSENSEDRSSKSSTAASALRHRHEGFGVWRERGSRSKNFSGKGSGPGHIVQQRDYRGKGGHDSSKKVRGDPVELRNENSRSSVESDLRSTNAASVTWGNTSSNGRHGEELLNYDGENSDEAQVSEALPTDFCKESRQQDEVLSTDNFYDGDRIKEEGGEEDENSNFHRDEDPFTKSIALLQEAHEALEKEIEKFEEIGKSSFSVSNDSSDQSYFEETEASNPVPLESKLIFLNKKVAHLESELQQASTKAEARELKVIELESILQGTDFPSNKSASDDQDALLKKLGELELEHEHLFGRSLEAEFECLALRTAIKTWALMVKDQSALIEEQKSLSEDYDQLIVKLNESEDKALMLKRKAKDLEASCKDLLGTEGVLVLQNKVFKSSLCFFLQIIVLFVAFWLFIMQLFSGSSEVVPT